MSLESSELPQTEAMQKIVYEKLGITIYAGLNTDAETLRGNIRTNIARGLPQVWPHIGQDTTIALVAGGPSLAGDLDKLRAAQAAGAKVVALANSARYLMENGIRPSAHILLDARPNPQWIVKIPKCTYFVASQCDPVMFDALEGERVLIWHAVNNKDELSLIGDYYDAWVPVQGGNTIALRAFKLLSILGYHRFDVYGLDSCWLDDRHHAYDQPAHDGEKRAKINCNGRVFEVSAGMIQQAMDFLKMVKEFGQDWEMRVNGDGLIAHMIKTGAQ